jgi:DNA-binding SARP family transcriptional activator
MLRVRLVGELCIEADDERLELPAPAKARALLAWLALHPGAHSRSEVAGTFWPDVLEESARASLRTALSAVRRSLGDAADGHLVATREAVGLHGAWVDALAFDELVAEGRPEEALALGEGQLLASLDDEWARDARDRQRRRRSEVLAQVAERTGDPAEAVRLARARLALDPLSEEAARDLIERLVAAGDRAGALVAYDELRERLRTTLAIAPSAATRALADSVRSRSERRPASSPLLDRRTAGLFVGRDAELARAAGGRGLVVIEGEAGVGKTRLALELARSARDGGGVALVGRCSEEPLRPYEAWAEALHPLLDDAGAGDREALAHLYGTGGASDAEGDRFRLFEAVRELLAGVAASWPVLVVLDDLHWADRPTLLLLAHLVRVAEGPPARLVGTYRSSDLRREHPLAALLADARRERLAERVSLRGLGAEATATLVAASTGPNTPERLARAVHAETAGNPFFVVEVARHLAETGAGSLAEVGLPESVGEVLGRRLERLGDPAHAVLRDAAVLGERFSAHALQPESETLLDALDAALAAGLVREEAGPPGSYAFAHALVRQTLYEELSAARRVRAHGAAAKRLLALREAGRPVSAAELAHHLIEAGRRATPRQRRRRPPGRPRRPRLRWRGKRPRRTPSAGCGRWNGSMRRPRRCGRRSCSRRARRRCAQASARRPASRCARRSGPTRRCTGRRTWRAPRLPSAAWGSSSAGPTRRSVTPWRRPYGRCRPMRTACAHASWPGSRSSATTSRPGMPAGGCRTRRWTPPAAPATTPPSPPR